MQEALRHEEPRNDPSDKGEAARKAEEAAQAKRHARGIGQHYRPEDKKPHKKGFRPPFWRSDKYGTPYGDFNRGPSKSKASQGRFTATDFI